MSIVLDSGMTEQQRQMAERVIGEFGLDNIKVIMKNDVFHFIQDRRVVHVPPTLILNDRWSDIRYLFKAILEAGPAVWNRGGDNTWDEEGPVYSRRSK